MAERKKCHRQGVERERPNKREQRHIKEKLNQKERDSKNRINEVFCVPPVVVIGPHGVPVGTIIGPTGKSQCLSVYVNGCSHVSVCH